MMLFLVCLCICFCFGFSVFISFLLFFRCFFCFAENNFFFCFPVLLFYSVAASCFAAIVVVKHILFVAFGA